MATDLKTLLESIGIDSVSISTAPEFPGLPETETVSVGLSVSAGNIIDFSLLMSNTDVSVVTDEFRERLGVAGAVELVTRIQMKTGETFFIAGTLTSPEHPNLLTGLCTRLDDPDFNWVVGEYYTDLARGNVVSALVADAETIKQIAASAVSQLHDKRKESILNAISGAISN